MLEKFKVLLFGTHTAVEKQKKKKSKKDKGKSAPKKRYFRLPDHEIAKAKAFHIYFRKSKRSKWKRLSPEIVDIPSIFRSKISKLEAIETYGEFMLEALYPSREKKVEPIIDIGVAPIEDDVDYINEVVNADVQLPELPSAPRVSITKKQFEPLIARAIINELDAIGVEWSDARIDSLIKKLWRNYSANAYLLTSEQFRTNLVIKEIIELRKEEKEKENQTLQETFRKELAKKDISLDPDIVGGAAKVQFKEVFNKLRMTDPEDMLVTKTIRGTDKSVTVDRQSVFTQVVVDYNEFIQVNADDISSNKEMLQIALDKVRNDTEKIFVEATEKGLFSFSDEAQYSVRLVMPMLDVNGEIPKTYISGKEKGVEREVTGYGFSTVRMAVNNLKDLDNLMDDLFSDLPKIIARYMALNNSIGIGFTGFMIERLLR